MVHEQMPRRAWRVHGLGRGAALAGWMGLLLPAKEAGLLLGATFAVHYAADRQFAQRFALRYYLRLRGGLRVVVLCRCSRSCAWPVSLDSTP